MAEAATYVYEPLDRSLSQIRLIAITPTADGPVHCTLKCVNLDTGSLPDYRALSYVWGPTSPTQRIYIDDRSLTVRQNLYDFLLSFRKRSYNFRGNGVYQDEVQWLWVDQICINQSVVEERNHQVNMMSAIYTKATYVYLDSTIVLQHFFNNPYWQRLWIVQEVMLARYIRIICGDEFLAWEVLSRFCTCDEVRSLIAPGLHIPVQTRWIADHALSPELYDLGELLDTFSQSQCENPLDKIFGLQGLLKQRERTKIDYMRSVEEVYFEAAYVICEGPQILQSKWFGRYYGEIDFCGSVNEISSIAASTLAGFVAEVSSTRRKLMEVLVDFSDRAARNVRPKELEETWASKEKARIAFYNEFKRRLIRPYFESASYWIDALGCEPWKVRTIGPLAELVVSTFHERTRHISGYHWQMRIFITQGYRFIDGPLRQTKSAQGDSIEYILERDPAWFARPLGDTDVEAQFSTEGAEMRKLTVVFSATSSGLVSMMIAIDFQGIMEKTRKIRFLSFKLDHNGGDVPRMCTKGTCQIFAAHEVIPKAFTVQDPEGVLSSFHSVLATSFVDLGRGRLRRVLTRKERPKDTSDDEPWCWRFLAVGFSE
ncbi:hypothetical protein OPT61_g1801 [Boeremia exigua]|uniref:Uncharacterized protein n=1 Tax=Boeremia exigua TaxID=749465 RepID=A0ACC2INR4_9PLEO|nr:hypothetical protein OPT61_g1801 [Boeremia exigua]